MFLTRDKGISCVKMDGKQLKQRDDTCIPRGEFLLPEIVLLRTSNRNNDSKKTLKLDL